MKRGPIRRVALQTLALCRMQQFHSVLLGAGKTVESAMRRKKRGTLRSGKGGKGGKVKSRKQAIAIGLSEAREKGAKVPRKKSS